MLNLPIPVVLASSKALRIDYDREIYRLRLSDAFSGRLLTFTEGPLKDNTFRVIRSFGTVPLTAGAEDIALAGCVVIDLAEARSQSVSYNGRTFNLLELANANRMHSAIRLATIRTQVLQHPTRIR